MEQEPHGSGQYFEFEQDSIQVIHFGNNVKGFKGNSNVLFDEIDGPNQRILTDLCIQGASHAKDLTDVSSKHQGPVLKCHLKLTVELLVTYCRTMYFRNSILIC